MDLFFLLSGFLMLAITDPSSKPGAFLGSRLRRIVPPYWIATSVLLAGGVAGLFPQMQLVPWHVLSSYLFIPSLSPIGKPWPLLVPGWTLNFEMFFYLSFALTMSVRSQARQVTLLAVLFGAAAAIGFALRPSNVLLATYTSPMLLWFCRRHGNRLWVEAGAETAGLGRVDHALCGGFAVCRCADAHTDAYRVVLFGVPSTLALISVLILEERRQIRRRAFPLLFGDASYPIYLWHGIFISFAINVCAALHLAPIAILLLGIACGLVGGVAGYRLVERPILKLMHARGGMACRYQAVRRIRSVLSCCDLTRSECLQLGLFC